MTRIRLLLAVFVLNYATGSFAVDPTLDWQSLDTAHFHIHFPQGYRAYAERTAVIAEQVHERLAGAFAWQPREKTHLVLSDESDAANGLATPLFYNRSVLYLAPPTAVSGLEDFDDWLTTLIVHEYAHVLHLDRAEQWPLELRRVFGRFPLLFPNLYQPAWVIEGVATWQETDFERGIGRGQSALFATMMRAEVAAGIKPVAQVNLPIHTWPAGTTRYLYGVYFMRFVAETMGEKQLDALVDRYSDNLLPFAINTTFREVFDEDVEAVWVDFEAWLKRRFAAQLATIESRGGRRGVRISETAYRTASLDAVATAAGEALYYIRSSGYEQPHLMRVDERGETQPLAELNTVGSLSADTRHGVLITQSEICDEYAVYRDIYRYDPQRGSLQRLTECGRYQQAVWLPDGGIIAVHLEGSRFELHRLDAEGALQEVLWGSGETVLSQIDLSADGSTLVASIWRAHSGWNIELFHLQRRSWQALTRDVRIDAYPRFTADDKHILFSRETDFAYNLVRYRIEDGEFHQLTNETGSAFQSAQATAEGPIHYIGYSAAGLSVYRLGEAVAVAMPPSAPSRLHPPEYDVPARAARTYDPWRSLRPRWWFPVFGISEDRREAGLTTAGQDALAIHNYALTASRDFELDVFAGDAVYSYADRFSLSVKRSWRIFRNSDGSFNRTRQADALRAVVAFPQTRIRRQRNLLLAVLADRESDGELAAGSVPAADVSDNRLAAAWLYNTALVHPLSISPNDGMNLQLVVEDSDTLNSDYSGQVYILDWKPYIRTGRESVLALRVLQGYGTDRPRAFTLGGESTGVGVTGLLGLSAPPVFDRRDYPLRGYPEGLPQLRGRRARLLSAEWRFPIQRSERGIMAPPVGMMQWSGAVFAETGTAYRDAPQKYYSSAGLEINADLNLFYALNLRLRLGYAHGFDRQLGDDTFYLQLGSSF